MEQEWQSLLVARLANIRPRLADLSHGATECCALSSHCYYQAIPESSRLLSRLRTEREFAVLYRQFVVLGPGLFAFDRLDPDAVDDTLDWVADEILEMPRAALNKAMREFCEELARADQEHAGLAKRNARLDDADWEIEEELSKKLRSVRRDGDFDLIKAVLRGGEPLVPQFSASLDVQPGLVDSEAVRKADALLKMVVFSDAEIKRWVYFWEQYKPWRQLIADAAQRGEALIVIASD